MFRNRTGLTKPYQLLCSVLRLLWVIVVVYNELWTFTAHVSRCIWPDASSRSPSSSDDHSAGLTSVNATHIHHVLVIADPQILNAQSYPGRHPWLMWLSQAIVDLNMRKSWRAAAGMRPDAVVFLGDMMDNGRMALSDEEYERYYRRFRRIFRASEPFPTFYLPGNHDVGLGASPRFSEHATDRYTSHFGPLNQVVDMGSHAFVLIDAPGLIAEESSRMQRGLGYAEWGSVSADGVIAFIRSLATHGSQKPVVLFTHIPLARPESGPCGPLRERGTIRQGRGFGYQNTLDSHTTEFLLQHIHPTAVFSGDDHDYCEYTHSYGSSTADDVPSTGTVQEVTVKSFSMAMGIRQPGFQLLSLGDSRPSLAATPCLLPDQLGIYLNSYVPLFLLSPLLLLAANVHRVRTRGKYAAWMPLPECYQRLRLSRTLVLFGRRMTLRLPLGEQPLVGEDLETGKAQTRLGGTVRSGVLGGWAKDIMRVAWIPLVVSVTATWWVS